MIPINNNIKNTPKIYLLSKIKEYLMESLFYSEENDEDQFIETNSANNQALKLNESFCHTTQTQYMSISKNPAERK